jgi:hypothetical protein
LEFYIFAKREHRNDILNIKKHPIDKMAIIVTIFILLAIIVFLIYNYTQKKHYKNEKATINTQQFGNNELEKNKNRTSYKNKYVELADIVPMTGQRADGPMDTFSTYIAGIGRYCNQSDIGYIIGRVMPEPNNSYNPNAMVIKDLDDKKLGYIADSQLKDYRDWSKCLVLPFIGYITSDLNRGFLQLSARIHVMMPISREFLLQRAGSYYGYKEGFKTKPKIKDLVIEIPKTFSNDYQEWNKNYGYRKEHNCDIPMEGPNGIYTYRYQRHMVDSFGYPIYQHLKINKNNTYKVSDLIKITDTKTPYLSHNNEQKVTETLNNMIYLSIIKVEWLDEDTFRYKICKDIPENPEWEKRRKWKQTLPK